MKIAQSFHLFRALAGNRRITVIRGRLQVIASIEGSSVVMVIDRKTRRAQIA